MPDPVKPNTDGHAIVSEEGNLHELVQERIKRGDVDGKDEVSADELDKDLIALRDMIAEAKPEDLAPLVEQMTRVAAIRSRMGKSKTLPVDPNSPYFAHMVLSESGKKRDVLIGKRGFIDRKSNVQIVDWRNAPVSQIYYRYEEGDDYDEEIAGKAQNGLVDVRRNISILGSKLRRIGSPQGAFVKDLKGVWHQAIGADKPTLQGGQGKAVRAPARVERHKPGTVRQSKLGVHGAGSFRSDKQLPEIAALIDKEQFELITEPQGGTVVIQGGAGSGKTTVALHRIAYLAFADKNRFRPSRILFVVPNDALVRYVASVLPSLGVHGVPVQTYSHWAKQTRLKLIKGSSKKGNTDTPDTVSKVKKHPSLMGAMETYVAKQTDDITDKIKVALQNEGVASDWLNRWQNLSKKALVPRLRRFYVEIKKSDLPSKTRISLEGMLTAMGKESNDVMADWANILTDKNLLIGNMTCSESEIDATVDWVSSQTNDSPDEDSSIEYVDGGKAESTNAGMLDPEDDPILLRLIQMKRGSLSARHVNEPVYYSHIAIDEAQDRSAIEVKVLIEAIEGENGDPSRRSVTIAGDTAQRIVFDNAFVGWEDMLKQTGQQDVVVKPLKLSYRSTAEVMALAREILGPDLMPADPLHARNGAPVELHEFGDVGEAVAFLSDALRGLLAREPAASVAVLSRYSEQADVYHAGLMRAEVPNVRRIRKEEFTFRAGVDVTDVSQVKGLEFDYVIMVDVNATSYPQTVESRHLLHIGATRAAHQLWILTTSLPCKMLPRDMIEGTE